MKRNRIVEVSTFLFFDDDQVVVHFTRRDQDGKLVRPMRNYYPSPRLAGILADIVWHKSSFEDGITVVPFTQTTVDAWGWSARLRYSVTGQSND